MSLSRGTQLDSCEILGLLGAGGMGEVYRGRDRELGRDVAVKALPAAFAHDAGRLARFEREAQVLASLNHPNLAIIHELKEVDGSKYLILELVEGETLAERIARGPIPVDEALPIAKQIAEGLEAAHDKGIVHRDLKPANVKITPDGRVKVLDFGLAKIYEHAAAPQNLSNSPTLSALQTAGGIILGTAAYMSPEQARGKDVDRRADVWAFGCVLYEMLTGRQTFPNGETVSDTLAGILARDPDWQALPANTPARIRALLERCLRKDSRRRWSGMADVRAEIEEARDESAATALRSVTATPSRRRDHVLTAAALLFFVITTVATLWMFFHPAPAAPVLRSEIYGPDGAGPTFEQAEISPDGRKIAFLAAADGNKPLIWIRPVDDTAHPLPGTDGAGGKFFWSPDSQYIGFFSDGKLKKVAAGGGPSQIVATLPGTGVYTGSWNPQDVILLGSETAPGPLLRVSAAGGQLTPASELDASLKESSHAYPYFLPDGRHYLYLARSREAQNTALAYTGELDSKPRRALSGIASEVRYSSGYAVFIRDGALMAQRFDPDKMEMSGGAFTLQDRFVPPSATGPFSVSLNGSLAYFRPLMGATDGTDLPVQLSWIDRKGKTEQIAAPPIPLSVDAIARVATTGYAGLVEVSSDGKSVAFDRGTPSDIWILDIEKRLTSPFTRHAAADSFPVWSPDGSKIAFRSEREGAGNLYERSVGVVGEDKPLLQDEASKFPTDWSRDGRYLAYYTGEGDIWALLMSGANASPIGRSNQETSGANASPTGRSNQETSGANASPTGRSNQETSGANASPIGRSNQETSGANASPTGRSNQETSGANASPTGRSNQGISGGSGGKPLRVTQTPFRETNPRISPDGHWIAYVSNEPGRDEVYVQSFPEPDSKQQVSTEGGVLPRWSRDGKELFFMSPVPPFVLWAVSIKPAGSSLAIGGPTRFATAPAPFNSVAPDGRLLTGIPASAPGTRGVRGGNTITLPHIVHIVNWASGLKK